MGPVTGHAIELRREAAALGYASGAPMREYIHAALAQRYALQRLARGAGTAGDHKALRAQLAAGMDTRAGSIELARRAAPGPIYREGDTVRIPLDTGGSADARVVRGNVWPDGRRGSLIVAEHGGRDYPLAV